LWHLYDSGKQTYLQLAERFGCSTKTVQRRLDSYKSIENKTFNCSVNVIMDTTYFGRSWGVMMFNALDGSFSNLKNKLRNHNGLSKKRKMKFIDGFLRHKDQSISIKKELPSKIGNSPQIYL
jgi:hypothetical protein